MVLIAVPWSVRWLLAWRWQWRHAAHVVRAAQLAPVIPGEGDPRFGSMDLTAEIRAWPEWDDTALASLRDPGPGGPDWSSCPPGPDFPDDGWLDAQLEELFTWVRAQRTEPA